MNISFNDLPQVRSSNPTTKIVLACGSFDVLHAGHIDYLEWAQSKGDVLVVSIPNDHAIRTEKNPDRPINNEVHRLRVVNSLRFVDYTVLTDEYDGVMKEVGFQLKPDVFVVYRDWGQQKIDELIELFPYSEVMVCPQEKINSSSSIIEKLNQ